MSIRLAKINKNNRQTIVTWMAIGLVFPVASWILDAIVSSQTVSITSIEQLHMLHPSIILIDIIPIIIGVCLYFLYINREQEKKEY